MLNKTVQNIQNNLNTINSKILRDARLVLHLFYVKHVLVLATVLPTHYNKMQEKCSTKRTLFKIHLSRKALII